MAATDPVLDPGEIQGDALAGFRKDNVRLLFVAFPAETVGAARTWLATLADQLAYLGAVHAFNTAFSRMRMQLAQDPPVTALWMNVGLTSSGLKLLAPGWDFTALDASFVAGAQASASLLGDAVDASGNPVGWQFGSADQPVHAMVSIAGDVLSDVSNQAQQVSAAAQANGFQIVYDQAGLVRASEPGHEHFGFRDCISQPGVFGRIGANGALVTARRLASTDPLFATFAGPGEPLLWPGHFVLGYPRKVANSTDPTQTMTIAVPAWMKNGSYQVVRKLRQDVPGFQVAVAAEAARLSGLPGFSGTTVEKAGALCVGRWKSGAPLERAPLQDNPAIGADVDAANSFFFDKNTAAVTYDPALNHPADPLPLAQKDAEGRVCPLSAHIRKVNPRDDTTDIGSPVRTIDHRIMRRGLPFGPDYNAADPASSAQERGLLFICYQSSISEQFEFLQHRWANSEDAPHDQAGVDLIIGQTSGAPRSLAIENAAGVSQQLSLQPFVTTLGSVYLFSPSRSALKALATAGAN